MAAAIAKKPKTGLIFGKKAFAEQRTLVRLILQDRLAEYTEQAIQNEDLTREEALNMAAEVYLLAKELKEGADFTVPRVDKEFADNALADIEDVMEERFGITHSEIKATTPPYRDMRGKPTALKIYRPGA